jgi:valyl-tRNA synthetase
MPFPEKYIHQEIETKWYSIWADKRLFEWRPTAHRSDSFVIDTPPPTVSGSLHMGHIFSYTQADFIARFKRMQGKSVFYPIGFDDNGLPTERLVEKTKKIRAIDLPRAEFNQICKEVVAESEAEFKRLFQSIGFSMDWSRLYQTISPDSIKLSQMSFLDLVEKGEIYRKPEPTLWDPVDKTALAQADIEDKEFDSFMNFIKFHDKDGFEYVIATTRPELLPACVAVLCHPSDDRFNHLIGTKLFTPLFTVEVPVIADELVDPDKGSGLVMCCTFGDTTDIEWWRKHNLPCRIILDQWGKLNNLAFFEDKNLRCKNRKASLAFIAELKGMKVKNAREKVLELLKSEGLLTEQLPITHHVKCAERSGSPIEILVTPQWFVKTIDKKEDLLEKTGQCKWYPEFMQKRLEIWIENLNWDWCISRQRYFGVPFPVWYSKRPGEEGKAIFASIDQLPVDPMNSLPHGYLAEELEADQDVMDTWATSSISPQLNSRAINENYSIDLTLHKQIFPADLRPQAHEIIRTWAFYTILKAHLHEDTVPWKSLMISGWCLAEDKTKMSKSKGNVVTPQKLIEEKSADVIRYWAANSKLGADVAYSEEVFAIGRKLVQKIWNAAKYSQIHLDNLSGRPSNLSDDISHGIIYEKMDLWIITKLSLVVKEVTDALEQFEYSQALTIIEDFFWKDFCDNYLEISKTRAYDSDYMNPEGQQSSIYCIYHSMKIMLTLFAPFIPFICEETNALLFEDEPVSAQNTWPGADALYIDLEALQIGDAAVALLNKVRKYKSEQQVSIKTTIAKLSVASADLSSELLKEVKLDIANVTNAEILEFCDDIVDYIDDELTEYKIQIH